MNKQALCIQRPFHVPPDGVYPLHGTMPMLPVDLIDRSKCENDESTLQLIPYIVVRGPKNGDILTYTRGKAGDENRLHAKRSIGLGGHVDRVPAPGESLIELLQAEGARELKEEIGYDADPASLHFSHIIIDRSDAVGRVHIGLLCVHTLSAHVDLVLERDTINDAVFVPLEDLIIPSAYDRLENWSKHVVDHLDLVRNNHV